MASEKTERFMRALQEAERANDPGGLVALFADRAELSKAGAHAPSNDPARFWGDYLAVFETIRSRFSLVVEDGDRAVLEWVSDGRLAGGAPLTYGGVSVLNWDGDKVKQFRTYYDTAAFVHEAGGGAPR